MVNHAEKEQLIHDHFTSTLGTPPPRPLDFKWDAIDPSIHDLDELGLPFTEEEIRGAIFDLPIDKAPGPDGFTSNFFRSCWPIV